MKKLMVAFAVAVAMAFGAQAKISSSTTAVAINAFVPLEGNILSGVIVDSAPAAQNESATNPKAALTDGTVGFGYSGYTYETGSFVYTLGDAELGYEVSAIRIAGGWGGGGWRGNIELSSVSYATAAEPDTWVTLPNSGASANSNGGNAVLLKLYDDEGDPLASGVRKVKLSFVASGYHGISEIEIAAVEYVPPAYIVMKGSYNLSNKITGSSAFVNSATVAVSGLPEVSGANEFAFDREIDKDNWENLDWAASFLSEQTLIEPETADADILGYAWYRNAENDGWIPQVIASKPIRYTRTLPTMTVADVTSKKVGSVAISVALDAVCSAVSGGVSAGEELESLDIPVFSTKLELVSGPGVDADTSDTAVTVTEPGTYTLAVTAVNAAGNVAVSNVTWTVEEVSVGSVTWNGSVSTDWNDAANWTPELVPPQGMSIVIPATGNNPVLPYGVYRFGSVTIESGATLFCLSDTTYPNTENGGSASTPLGRGSEIICTDFTVAGTLSTEALGLATKTTDGGAAHGGSATAFGSGIYKSGYGHISRPTTLGNSSGSTANPGGGAIKIVASGTVTVSGTITASAKSSGRSAAGSVWIRARTLAGTGKILAKGGTETRYGAGGRVALEAVNDQFAGTVDVFMPYGRGDNPTYSGTLFRNCGLEGAETLEAAGFALESVYSKEILNASIVPWDSGKIKSGEALTCARQILGWDAENEVFKWREGCYLKATGTPVENAATYTLGGLTAGDSYYYSCDGVLGSEPIVADANGSVTFTVTLNSADGYEVMLYNSKAVSYAEILDYSVGDEGTLGFCGASPAEVSNLVYPEGADSWTQTDVGERSAAEAAAWTVTDALPTEQAFTAPAADADMTIYTWFRKSDDDGYMYRRAAGHFRFTTVKPVVSCLSTLTRNIRTGSSITVEAAEYDTGSTGGESSGDGLETLAIPLNHFELEVVSGPGSDSDGSARSVTLSVAGTYAVNFIAVNDAGNRTVREVKLVIGELTPGSEFSWTGAAGNADWYEPGNWDLGAFPIAGDNVVIPAGLEVAPILSAGVHPKDGGSYGKFTIEEGATVICLGDPTAVNAASGGTASKPHGIGVTVNCASAEIAGHLNADNQGFAAGMGPGGWSEGASYGGAAYKGANDWSTMPQKTEFYGRAAEPTALGSGGTSAGGGAIKLVCSGKLKLDGTISASCNAASTARGSGGSVWIVCDEFSGSGNVFARSENKSGRVGGGGRIAIYHNTTAFTGVVSAKGDTGGNSSGMFGTLYEPGRYPTGTAESPADVTFGGDFCYIFPDATPHYWNLTVVAGSTGGLRGGVLHLGDFTLGGDNTYLEMGSWIPGMTNDMKAVYLDSLTLSDTAKLRLPGGYSGTRTYALDSLDIASGATLFFGWNDWNAVNEEGGGTAAVPLGRGVEIRAKNVTVAGALSVSRCGFGNGKGPNPSTDYGSGHGGAAHAQNNIGQRGYGSFSAPTTLGNSIESAGFGGGAVRLSVSDTLALTGTIAANGLGRGSGGSIWIVANHFTGSGTLSANSANDRRPSGGGRIAIEAVDDQFDGKIDVTVGAKWGDNQSYPGTVFRSTAPSFAAIDFDVGTEKLTASYAKNVFNSSVESDWANVAFNTQFVINRQITTWKSSSYAWTESCALASGKGVANTATYVLNDLTPNVKAEIKVNGEALVDGDGKPYHVAADGTLTFPVNLAAGVETTVSVTLASGMSLIVR